MARFDAARVGGFITRQRTAIAEDPTLTERPGNMLLEIHAAFQANRQEQRRGLTHE